MCNLDVNCPATDCFGLAEYECEHEESGAGSEHEVICPDCGHLIKFEIEYEPVASNER